MSTDYKYLLLSRKNKILTITLNRPDQLNSADPEMHEELSRVFGEINADETISVAVLTGAGKAFSAGADVSVMQRWIDNPKLFEASITEAKRLVFSILDCEKPIICRMNGDAIGLGATMALLCDCTIAVDTARIGDPHVRIGLVAGDGGAVIWPQLIGYARAKEFLMMGSLVSAPQAAAMGLINYAVSAEELDQRVDAFSSRLANGATQAIKWTKATINIPLKQIAQSVMDAGMAYEALSNLSKDHAEAVKAFVERRPPQFSGN